MGLLQKTDVPIYENTNLSLPKMVAFMGVTRDIFSEISGISKSTIRGGAVSNKTLLLVGDIVNIITLLWKLSEKRADVAKHWLHTPQDQYWGLSPIQFMKIERANIQTVFKNLQEIEYGEAMGR